MKKLTEEEVKEIKAFIGVYNELFSRIYSLEKDLEKLSIKKNKLSDQLIGLNDELTKIRAKEEELNKRLRQKYGNFKLNIENFEIELT